VQGEDLDPRVGVDEELDEPPDVVFSVVSTRSDPWRLTEWS